MKDKPGCNCTTLAVNGPAHYQYGPEVLRSTGPMAKANPLRFSTKYQDEESDMVYYPRGRYYMPSTGRWATRDPLGEEGDEKLYAFVANSPVTAIAWLVPRKLSTPTRRVSDEELRRSTRGDPAGVAFMRQMFGTNLSSTNLSR